MSVKWFFDNTIITDSEGNVHKGLRYSELKEKLFAKNIFLRTAEFKGSKGIYISKIQINGIMVSNIELFVHVCNNITLRTQIMCWKILYKLSDNSTLIELVSSEGKLLPSSDGELLT